MPDSQTLGLIIAASVAAAVLFRLYTVLGRRTGHEPQAQPRQQPQAGEPRGIAAMPSDPVARGLMEIQLSDRNFDQGQFLKGARTAYDMIQKAFANGDRLALRPLLSQDVFAAFEQEIAARNGPPAETLAGITDARITAAGLHDDTAEVTVAFRAQFAKGEVQRDVSDLWTFARKAGSADPNWTLVATSGEAA